MINKQLKTLFGERKQQWNTREMSYAWESNEYYDFFNYLNQYIKYGNNA